MKQLPFLILCSSSSGSTSTGSGSSSGSTSTGSSSSSGSTSGGNSSTSESGSSSSGGGGGGSSQVAATSEAIQKKVSSLSSEQKTSIAKQLQEKTPYTSMENVMTVAQLEKLTDSQFTKAELEKMVASPELIKELGVDVAKMNTKVSLAPKAVVDFKDVSHKHWAKDAISNLAQKGIFQGQTEASFAPNQSLQVADTFVALDRVLLLYGVNEMQLDRSTVEKYVTQTDHWAFANMASVASKLSEGTLKQVAAVGSKDLSRELLAQVLYEVTKGKIEKVNASVEFIDAKNSPYREALAYCSETGLLNGTGHQKVSPEKALTRAELATVLNRLMDRLV